MCDCIKAVEEKLTEMNGSKTQLYKIWQLCTGDINQSLAIPYTYHKKKKDGTLEAKETTASLTFGYCPFCGKEYVAE